MTFRGDVIMERPHVADHATVQGHRPTTAEELACLKRRLREHRRFRQKQLRDLLSSPRSSQLQQGRTAAQIEVQAELTAAALQVLGDVEIALIRMNTGQYGDCLRCGGAVGLQRLQILPYTRYCARCHRAEEIGA